MKTHALAADLGGTNIRVALLDREGRISHRYSTPTLAHLGRDAVLERFLAAIDQVRASGDLASVAGIGVSVASPVDPDSGVMHDPPNLPGWDGFSAKPTLEETFSLDVAIANDATVAALAEHRYGSGRGYRHMIYITLSTGIGGGVVIDGRLYTGARGYAGGIGHITIDRNGPPCNCGNLGCLEAMSSGTAVARMARERLASGAGGMLLEMAGGPDSVDAKMVAEAAFSGDRTAQAIMAEVCDQPGRRDSQPSPRL